MLTARRAEHAAAAATGNVHSPLSSRGRRARSRAGSAGDGRLGPWTADGKGVFVNERDNFTIHVFRRDLATGQRTRRKDFSFDTAGRSWFNPLIAADGQSYVFNFGRL